MIISRPIVTCTVCKMTRHPELHMRADEPVEAARRWLRKRCGSPDQCAFTYRAGIEVGGPVRGQTEGRGQEE